MKLLHRLFFFILLIASSPVRAQDVETDTVTHIYNNDLSDPEKVGKLGSTDADGHSWIIGRNKNKPTAARWQELTSRSEFSYRNEKEYHKPKPPQKENAFQKFFIWLAEFFASVAGKTVLILFGLLLLGYILYRIFSGDGNGLFTRSKKIVRGKAAMEETEDLLGTNWEDLLRDAIQKDEKRTAVRYAYMWLLQLMQQRELVQYRQDKTNSEYAAEITDDDLRQNFRKMSRQYEFAWYGHFIPDKPAFEMYLNTFEQVKRRLVS